MQVTIVHNQTAVTEDGMNRYEGEHEDGCLGMFFNFCAKCIARIAYSYETDTGDLDGIWRANNRVDGSQFEVVPDGSRSLSVGDVIVLDNVSAYKVDNFGFSPVELSTVLSALSQPVPEGYVL